MPRFEVFIAHASPDKALATELHAALSALGLAPFLDKPDIHPGTPWDQELHAVLTETRLAAVLIGPTYDAAWYLRDEVCKLISLYRAHPERVAVVPVFLNGFPSEGWKIPYGLSPLNGLSWPGEGGATHIANRIATVLGRAGSTASLFPSGLPLVHDDRRRARFHELVSLLPPQLATLLFLSEAPLAELPPEGRPQAERAVQISLWLEALPPERRVEFDHHLKQVVSGPRRGLPPALWASLQALTDVEMTTVLEILALADILPPRSEPLALRRALLGGWAGAATAREDDLRAAISIARGGKPSPAESAGLWLHKQRIVADKLRILTGRTGESWAPIRLGELFVDVELVAERGAHFDGAFDGGRIDKAQGAHTLPSTLRLSAEQKDRHCCRGVVLIGMPGSGKSTLLAQQVLQDAEHPTLTLLLRFSTLQRLLPRSLAAGDLRSWARLESAEAGFPEAADVLLAETGRPYRFLLDGFDELATQENRRAVMDWLLLVELDHWPESEFVLSTRRAAWKEEDRSALEAQLLPWTLLRLTKAAIREYISDVSRCSFVASG